MGRSPFFTVALIREDVRGTLGEATSGPRWRASLALGPRFGQLSSSFCPIFCGWGRLLTRLTPSRALLLLLVASWDIPWALHALPWPPQDRCGHSTEGAAKARTREATCLWGLSVCHQRAVSPARPSPPPRFPWFVSCRATAGQSPQSAWGLGRLAGGMQLGWAGGHHDGLRHRPGKHRTSGTRGAAAADAGLTWVPRAHSLSSSRVRCVEESAGPRWAARGHAPFLTDIL